LSRATLVLCALVLAAGVAAGAERFPPPDFTSGHRVPEPTTAPPRSAALEYVDVAVLVVALSAASLLALRFRSRTGLLVVMIFSLGYFGFYRKGCICPIGAIQNVAMGIFDSGYAVPVVVLAFFLLPLVFTLLFGRTFCAAVCPLGAIQDIVVLKPLRVPGWLGHALGLLPYAYLGAAVLLAATGGAFLICRYDPFVGLFRLSADLNMLILGACFLVIGMFVARPYCRFLCPYGAILRPLSAVSKWHVTITPEECVRCRLCEDACPFNAIRPATPEVPTRPRTQGKGVLAGLLILLPVLIVVGGWLGSWLDSPLSAAHYKVRLAEQVRREELVKDLSRRAQPGPLRIDGREVRVETADGQSRAVCTDQQSGKELWRRPLDRGAVPDPVQARLAPDGQNLWVILQPEGAEPASGSETVHALICLRSDSGRLVWRDEVAFGGITSNSYAFRNSVEFRSARRREKELYEDLYAQAGQVRRQIHWGGWAFGAFLGAVVGLKLISLSVYRRRDDHVPDRATCLSCGRCFRSCPVERRRLKAKQQGRGEPAEPVPNDSQ